MHCILSDIPAKVDNASCKRNYTSNTLVTIWSPVFSLDINDTDPDIIYDVQLFRTTCGQITFIDQTTVAGSSTSEENLDLMQIYKAVIAARNNVPGARNGPSVEMEGIVVIHQHVHVQCTCSYCTLLPYIMQRHSDH